MERRVIQTTPQGAMKEGLRDILKKSSSLIAREGFHGTSMRGLAEATGRSLSGLYHYFASKEDLLFLINFYGFTALNETWKRMSESFHTSSERLYGFIYLHTNYYIAHIDEMRVMNWGTQALAYDRAVVIKQLKDQHTSDARTVIRDVYKERTGRDIDGTQLTRQTYLLFGMMNWIFGWYSSRTHGGVDELIRDIYRTFMFGITASHGDEEGMDKIEMVVSESFHNNKDDSLWHTAGVSTVKPSEPTTQ